MWSPSPRVWFYESHGDAAPRILAVALTDFLVCCAYTALTTTAAASSSSLVGAMMVEWIGLTHGATASILFFLPESYPSVNKTIADGIATYRHVVVACSAITLACINLSKRYWPAWSREFLLRSHVARTGTALFQDPVADGYHMSVLGLAATVFLLLLAEPRDPSTIEFLYSHVWTNIRVPILLAIATYFACHVLMLRLLRSSRGAE